MFQATQLCSFPSEKRCEPTKQEIHNTLSEMQFLGGTVGKTVFALLGFSASEPPLSPHWLLKFKTADFASFT